MVLDVHLLEEIVLQSNGQVYISHSSINHNSSSDWYLVMIVVPNTFI